MGWGIVGDIGKAAVSSIGKVAEVATGGAVGKIISDALERFGLPKEICGILACIGDPSYSTKFLAEEIDRVGKALGLPEELTGALKKVLNNAEKYAQAFAKGGFGAVVAEVGKDLGLPPELYLAVAAGIDAYTGNAPGAAANLARLAGQCARHLGVPEDVINVVEFAGAAYAGDTKAMAAAGFKVIDGMDILPPEMETFAHAAIGAAVGDDEVVRENLLKFGTQVAEKLGLPPEAVGLVQLAAAYQQGDDEAIKAALKEVGNKLVERLPPELQALGRQAVEKFAEDPKAAWEAIKNLDESAKQGFKALTAAAKNPETLKQVAELGIRQLPPEIQGPVRQAVDKFIDDPKTAIDSLKDLPKQAREEFTKLLDRATDPAVLKQVAEFGIRELPPEIQGTVRQAVDKFIDDPKAALESLESMPKQAREEFGKLLEKATDPAYLRQTAKELLDSQVAQFSPDVRKAYDLSVHLATGDFDAVREDLKKFSEAEIKKLPASTQEALRIVGQIANGDTQALKGELEQVKERARQEIAAQYHVPIRT
ncbi:MAG TPA: hypothetical protein VGG33_04370 [Polyangia bacterium]